MRFQTGYYFRKGMVGRSVYGSRGTIVKITSRFFQGRTLGAEWGACTRGTLRYYYFQKLQ